MNYSNISRLADPPGRESTGRHSEKPLIHLSKRLQAVADMVSPCVCAADIGTDHGYLPVVLIESGRAQRAIAMDVRKGPLSHAEETVRRSGLSDRIELRLSDGLEKLSEGEADAAVLSGMGGLLICRILRDGLPVMRSLSQIVAEPQSETDSVRYFLYEHGFRIDREDMVLEQGKYYPVIHGVNHSADVFQGKNVHEKDCAAADGLTKAEAAFGPCLLRDKNAVLLSYLRWREQVDQNILKTVKASGSTAARERAAEVEEDLRLIKEGYRYYEM